MTAEGGRGRWRVRALLAVIGVAIGLGQCAGPELLDQAPASAEASR
jgi:hypothetical protein